MTDVDSVYQKSIELLKKLAVEQGFVATTKDVNNYRRVWARDGMVMGLAGLPSGDSVLLGAFKETIKTMKAFQDETGRIPSNVSPIDNAVSYGTTVGRIDATLWYVIGVCQYYLETDDKTFFAECKASLSKAVFYLSCLELNGRGFIYVPQGGDWADEYINHGYVLYDELLYYFALASYAKCTGDQSTIQKKDYLREMIRVNFLPKKEYIDNEHVYNKGMYERTLYAYKPPLPLAYFSNHSARFHIDTFAISLLLLSGAVDSTEAETIRSAVLKETASDFPILPSFHPVIKEGDHNWEHLKSNFLYKFKNEPYQFHNGGRWSLVHGFFLASYSGDEGKTKLEQFAEIIERDNFMFPEYYDGKTFEPKGTSPLGFSISAFLIAYHAIQKGKPPFDAIK